MTDRSRNLELISNGSEPGAPRLERRRVPRLDLTSEQFRLRQNGKIFPVADLSTQGMALRVIDKEDYALFSVGARVEGTLNLRGEKIPVVAKVKNLRGDLAGCEFNDLESSSAAALRRMLDPVALGAELRPVPSQEPDSVWYHGPSGVDLIAWTDAAENYRRFVLYLFGGFVQWDPDEGLTTGRTLMSDEESELRGVVRMVTLLLDPDRDADAGKLKVAKELVLSSNLPEDMKKWCASRLDSV